jgi:hypothetical protein
MADYHGEGESTVITKVQLTDLENAGYLPKGRCIKGMLAGNDNWRSPEAHLRGELNKPTDVFSFGIVVGSLSIFLGFANMFSASTLCSVASSSAQTMIST